MRPCMRPRMTLHATLATLRTTLAGGISVRRQGRQGSAKGCIPALFDPGVFLLFMRVLSDTGSQGSALSINERKRKKGGTRGVEAHIKGFSKHATLAPLQQPCKATLINIFLAITAANRIGGQ
jgi:hypothetical protein